MLDVDGARDALVENFFRVMKTDVVKEDELLPELWKNKGNFHFGPVSPSVLASLRVHHDETKRVKMAVGKGGERAERAKTAVQAAAACNFAQVEAGNWCLKICSLLLSRCAGCRVPRKRGASVRSLVRRIPKSTELTELQQTITKVQYHRRRTAPSVCVDALINGECECECERVVFVRSLRQETSQRAGCKGVFPLDRHRRRRRAARGPNFYPVQVRHRRRLCQQQCASRIELSSSSFVAGAAFRAPNVRCRL